MQPPKYPRTLYWPWSPTIHKDDKVHQNPEHFVGKKVIITEKIDGGNTLLYNGDVYARSVGSPSADKWFAMVKKYHAWKSFSWEPDTFVYGEDIYGVHSIEYEPIHEAATFSVFAIRKGNVFLSWGRVRAFCNEFGFKTVPEVSCATFASVEAIQAFLELYMEQPSFLGGEREGFVMRIADEFLAEDFALNVCKYVRPDHVQTDEHWRKNWKPCKIIR